MSTRGDKRGKKCPAASQSRNTSRKAGARISMARSEAFVSSSRAWSGTNRAHRIVVSSSPPAAMCRSSGGISRRTGGITVSYYSILLLHALRADSQHSPSGTV